MTHFSDPLYQGDAPTNVVDAGRNISGLGVGPMFGVIPYTITPATLGTALVAALQTTAGAGNLVLTAGAGVTTVTRPDGQVVLQLDVPRNLTLTSAGNISGVTFTVTGYDFYRVPETEVITGPNANTVQGNVAFSQIVSIAVSGAVGTNTSVGMGDKFGLPLKITQAGQLLNIGWAGGSTRDASTVVVGSTAANADNRGTLTPSSASNGSRTLVVGLMPLTAQMVSGLSVDVVGY